jgi:hypothetical protein
MSLLNPILKTKSIPAKILFIASVIFAGPVSFFLYDFYIKWLEAGTGSISWYLAFFYDTMGAWGGVSLSLMVAVICYFFGMKFHNQKKVYYLNS